MGQLLSDTETLLWSLGRDPNLASTMGLVAILDGKPDLERMRNTLRNSVAEVDRLQQRVVSPSVATAARHQPGRALGRGAFGRPEWVIDDQFDFDHHVRAVRLATPGPAGEADLRRAAAQFINDPFDLTRPLWQFLIITGLARGRAALLGKVHHSISDGIGMLRLAGNLLELEADAAAPEPVDLDRVFAAKLAQTAPTDEPKSGSERLLGWLQQAAGSIPNPVKLVEAGAQVVASARTVGGQLPKSSASQLWSTRSRNRRLEFCAVPLASLKARADALEVTLNDLFVAACAEAAVHYHRQLGADLPKITATVVVSIEPSSADGALGSAGDNSFIPVAIELPGLSASAEDRLEIVHSEIRSRRRQLQERGDGLHTISALTGLVPSSVAAALAVDQAAKVDFATSNIPGPPVPAWLAGQPVRRLYPVGPVAGTAFNITLITFDREALLGIHLDPAAVTEPAVLQAAVGQGFADFGVARR